MSNPNIKAVCDRCGFDYRLSQLRKEWTGLMVCDGPGTSQCWERRHPQDFVRSVPPDRLPYEKRPVGVYVFINAGDVTAVTAPPTPK